MGLAERILVVRLKRFSYPGYSTLSHFKLNDSKAPSDNVFMNERLEDEEYIQTAHLIPNDQIPSFRSLMPFTRSLVPTHGQYSSLPPLPTPASWQ